MFPLINVFYQSSISIITMKTKSNFKSSSGRCFSFAGRAAACVGLAATLTACGAMSPFSSADDLMVAADVGAQVVTVASSGETVNLSLRVDSVQDLALGVNWNVQQVSTQEPALEGEFMPKVADPVCCERENNLSLNPDADLVGAGKYLCDVVVFIPENTPGSEWVVENAVHGMSKSIISKFKIQVVSKNKS
jgi:hypothetical protein